MIAFWVFAGAMVVVALAVLLWAMLRPRPASLIDDEEAENVRIARERLAELREELRAGNLDQAAFDRARADLEAALAADLGTATTSHASQRSGRWLGLAVAAAVPALAIYLYLALGSPGALNGPAVATLPQQHPDVAQQENLPSVDEMLAQLVQRLQDNPNDAEGWFMLGRSYLALGRYEGAVEAFERVESLVGDDPNVLVAHADALAMLQGGQLKGEPMALVQRALEQDPNSPTALWLAGMGFREAGDLDKAIAHWRRAKDSMPPESDAQGQLQALIDQAQAAGGQAPAEAAAPTPVAAAAAVQVEVTLAPDLQGAVDRDATVFVFATPPDGSRMPVAAVKRRVADLPLQLKLSDADALAPVAKISNYQQVQVGARISQTGNAMPASGDLIAQTRTVPVGQDQVTQLVIDGRVP